jgi:hypothetical protein
MARRTKREVRSRKVGTSRVEVAAQAAVAVARDQLDNWLRSFARGGFFFESADAKDESFQRNTTNEPGRMTPNA